MEYTEEKIKALSEAAHVHVATERALCLADALEKMHALASVLGEGKDLPDPFLGAAALDGMREDRIGESMTCEEVLRLSPERERDCVRVPRALEGES